MKLNLYKHLKLATELSDAIEQQDFATHLEHRSLGTILDLINIIRQLNGDNDGTNNKTISPVHNSGDLFGSTLGYGRKNN